MVWFNVLEIVHFTFRINELASFTSDATSRRLENLRSILLRHVRLKALRPVLKTCMQLLAVWRSSCRRNAVPQSLHSSACICITRQLSNLPRSLVCLRCGTVQLLGRIINRNHDPGKFSVSILITLLYDIQVPPNPIVPCSLAPLPVVLSIIPD
jgi:hypothetical protein